METTPNAEPSFADLRAMLADQAPAPAETPKPETSEPAAQPAEESHEPATETGETKQEPAEPKDEELPEGVRKRIAKEAERAARIQAEIDRAVSERKAREAELAKLQSEKGSEPVKQPQSDGRPKRPVFTESGHEDETWSDFEARLSKHEEALEGWIQKQSEKTIEQKLAEREAKRAAAERWDAAVKQHGKDFPSLMEQVVSVAPEGLQTSISQLDDWSAVAVHLAKNPEKLRELSEAYQKNPTKAIATLGRIEAALTSKPEPKPATAKPLPEPVKPVGGSASAGGESLQDILEGGSFTRAKNAVIKIRGQ